MSTESLRRSRAATRGHVTRALANLRTQLSQEPMCIVQVESILNGTDLLLSSIRTLDNEIVISLPDDSLLEAHVEESYNYLYAVDSELAKARHTLKLAIAASLPPVEAQPAAVIQPIPSRSCKVTLPKLTLPHFSGDILEWPTFYESFMESVDKNDIPNVQKLTFLRSFLEGPALRKIVGLSTINSNYPIALKILKDHYGQEYTVVESYMNEMSKLPHTTNDLDELETFYNDLIVNKEVLNTHGKDVTSYESLLVPQLIKRLPDEILDIISSKVENRAWVLKDIEEGLKTGIRILSRKSKPKIDSSSSFLANSNNQYQRQSSNPPKRFQNQQLYGPHQFQQPAGPPQVQQKVCQFCSGFHQPTDCTKYNTPELRKQRTVELRLCINCLRSDHYISKCFITRNCKLCRKRHHTSLCLTTTGANQASFAGNRALQNSQQPTTYQIQSPTPQPSQTSGNNRVQDTNMNLVSQDENLETDIAFVGILPSSKEMANSDPTKCLKVLKTAFARVSSPTCNLETSLLFDDGSQKSFISDHLFRQLQLKEYGYENLRISAFNSRTPEVKTLIKAELGIECLDGSTITIYPLVIPYISTPIDVTSRSQAKNIWQFKDINFAHPLDDEDPFDIQVLVGADFYYDVIQDYNRRSFEGGPVAVPSKIGFLLSGPVPSKVNLNNSSVFKILAEDQHDDHLLQRFWDLEAIGISHYDQNKRSSLDVEKYCNSIEFSNGKFTAELPWKSNCKPLPTNYDMCFQRTKSAIKRLVKNETLDIYSKVISDQLSKGFIEIVPGDNKNIGHYLSHRPVFKKSSTTPIRIVFDCSSRQNRYSPSLNDCLDIGPALQKHITSILLRFRTQKFGITSDIEKAFLNIKLASKDQPFTKFLYLKDPKDPDSEFVTYQFKVLLFGAGPSPFILNTTILKLLRLTPSELARLIEENIYVDNVISEAETEREAVEFFHQSRALIKSGGFNLRSFASNSKELMYHAIKEKVNEENLECISVLGLNWNTITDTLSFKPLNMPYPMETVTKRQVSSITAKHFDVLGYTCPVVFNSKVLLQDLWKEKMGWDKILNENYRLIWNDILKDLISCSKYSFPRQYFPDCSIKGPFSIHIFGDASKRGYATACYLVKGENSSLIMARSRVAPLKNISIPTLELTAANITARLYQHIKAALKDFDVTFHLWSDSQVALFWILDSKLLNKYEAERKEEIDKLTHDLPWRWCPTALNPADKPTRGLTYNELIKCDLWWYGPKFITQPESQWPTWNPKMSENVSSFLLSRAASSDDGSPDSTDSTDGIHNIIEIKNFTNLRKLLRVTSYVRRWFQSKTTNNTTIRPVSSKELSSSLKLWILSTQIQSYSQEYAYLVELGEVKDKKLKKTKIRCPPLVPQLNLILKDSLITSEGRLHNSSLEDTSKYPIFLPSKHYLTYLIVIECHSRVFHSGVTSTISRIRQEYWIPKIRQIVKSIIFKCILCKKLNGKPFAKPKSPPLVQDRVKEAPSFTVTGVDFSGYYHVMSPANPKLEIKVYICLFTCAATRCVHLEVVTDMSLDTLFLAFRRFCSRRSIPQTMISDNGSSFVALNKELKELLRSPVLYQDFASIGCNWKFIPKKAPWFGGFYEKLVGITKRTLKTVMGRAKLKYTEFITLVTEAEAIINDRPLSYISDGLTDPEPITPSQLFQGRRITCCPHPVVDEDALSDPDYITGSILQRRIKHRAVLHDHFYKRWKREYLVSLRERHSSFGTTANIIQTGDVVQVHDESSRLYWKLAVVTSLNYGADGIARSANIRTANGSTNRPISKLYPLEISSNSEDQTSSPVHDTQVSAATDTPIRPPTRQAAILARDRIRECT